MENKIPLFINKNGKYVCKNCGEKFRLKMSLNNHKCRGEDGINKINK